MNLSASPRIAAAGRFVWKYLRSYWPLLAAIVLLIWFFDVIVVRQSLTKYPDLPALHFLTPENTVQLLDRIVQTSILAFGMTMVILVGGIDLSVGAVMALSGVVSVALLGSCGAAMAIVAGLAAACLVGVINGTFAARTKMPPFIITLGMMEIIRGSALRFNEGKPMSVGDNAVFLALGSKRLGDWLPLPVVMMFVMFVITALVLHRTRFGQHLFAIGGNREAARFTGISIRRHEVVVYALCGFCAGLCGLINASRLYSAEPAFGVGSELDAIAAVVVGGTSFSGGVGSMLGTLLGAIVIGIVDKGLNSIGVHHSFQHIVKGAVIIAAVWLDSRRRK